MTSFTWFMFMLSAVLLWGARRLYRRELEERFVDPMPPLRMRSAPSPALARSTTTAVRRTGTAPVARQAQAPVARQAQAPAVRQAHAPVAPAVKPRPQAEALEWITPPKPITAPEARKARLRDRYIAARFPGVLRGTEDLLAIEYVIKVARHYFEEGQLDDAAELFDLAIAQSPKERALRLAQLEITFLARDAARYTHLAGELRAIDPGLAEWDQVSRLGRALAPAETLFLREGEDAREGHYGPWPEMPNWIQASWDLTSEVHAADFHRAMAEAPAKTNQE